MAAYGFVIDNRKCIGCHACTVACKQEHDVPLGVNRTWVKYIEKGVFPNSSRAFHVMRCNHCDAAPCVEACPVTALYKRSDGIVDFNSDRCIGCKACTQACPYDALYIDPDARTAAKCNYCAHRVDVGLEPACVWVCPVHAIVSGDMDDPASEISLLMSRERVVARKPWKGTIPKLFYIDGDDGALGQDAAPPASDYMWSSQRRGVGHHASNGRHKGADRAEARHSAATAPAPQPGPAPVPAAPMSWEGPGGGAAPVLQLLPEYRKGDRSLSHNMERARRVYDPPDKGVMWGREVPAYVWTKAISAGAVAIPFTAVGLGVQLAAPALWTSVLLGLVLLLATGLLLISDLDRPDRFHYVLLRPQWRSWLVKGAYIITAYGGLLSLWVLLKLLASVFGVLPGGWSGAVDRLLAWPLAGLAAATAAYTAFLFAQCKGRDFWETPMLPLHMLVHAALAGAASLWLASLAVDSLAPLRPALLWTMGLGVLAALGTMWMELYTKHPSLDSERTAKMIYKGRYSGLFWYGSVLLGLVVPGVLVLTGVQVAVAAAAVLVLAGIAATEIIWVDAPQRLPLA